ncbi:MAG TPA: AAA domain-containing protein [Actinopolymorphaceae bacterium]|jgi:hypothetical protein
MGGSRGSLEEPVRSGWRAEAIAAAECLVRARSQGGSAASSSESRWSRVGEGRSAGEPGWLAVDKRGDSNFRAESIQELCLADGRGPDAGLSYPIEDSRVVDGVLWVKVPPACPRTCRYVWQRTVSLRFLAESLRSGLRHDRLSSLADDLAEGRLAAKVPDVPPPPEFTTDQFRAYRACFLPGVRLVWGPPGTGKTHVLARAIEDLVKKGKRVLLTSTANIAVDNAFYAVARNMRAEAGVLVRVGPPHLRELAESDDLRLDRLAARMSAQVDSEREEIERRLARFEEAGARMAELDGLLERYDHAEFLRARERLERAEHLRALRPQIDAAQSTVDSLSTALEEAQQKLTDARRGWDAIAVQRELLSRAARLEQQLSELGDELAAARARLAELELMANRRGTNVVTRWRSRRAYERESKYLQKREENAAHNHARLDALIADCRHRAAPIDDDEVNERLMAMRRAEEQSRQLGLEHQQATRALADLEHRRRAMLSKGVADEVDRRCVELAESQKLPQLYAERDALREDLRRAQGERGRLEQKHRELVDKAKQLRNDAQKEILTKARVVATTLARTRVMPVLSEQRYDVVLVDEAGAAAMAEVLLAVGQATTTAVLFGDFLQLPPIVDERVRDEPVVRKWLGSTAFDLCGIRTPKEAVNTDGCVSLLEQFRFGDRLLEFANEVIYEVLCPPVRSQARPDTEIVLVDVSDVPELVEVHGTKRMAGWWPIGALIARVIAEHHIDQGDTVGIVTPFREQAQATLAALQDTDSRGLAAAVGTVHRFQGRQFDTVIFDLVEDGRRQIAKARRRGNQFDWDSLRLFGVGMTRAQHRLYIIVDGRAVQTAKSDQPLGILHRLWRERGLRRCRAGAMLGTGTHDAPPSEDSLEIELHDALARHIEVVSVDDEMSFAATLTRCLDEARSSVWIWSPWVSTKAHTFIPALEAAAARNVVVRVVVRATFERDIRGDRAREAIARLLDSAATVIRSDVEHRKVIVIDDHTVLLGSNNALSQSRSREIMVGVRGRAFVKELAKSMNLAALEDVPHCRSCGCDYELRRSQDRRRGAPYFWRCPLCRADKNLSRADI